MGQFDEENRVARKVMRDRGLACKRATGRGYPADVPIFECVTGDGDESVHLMVMGSQTGKKFLNRGTLKTLEQAERAIVGGDPS